MNCPVDIEPRVLAAPVLNRFTPICLLMVRSTLANLTLSRICASGCGTSIPRVHRVDDPDGSTASAQGRHQSSTRPTTSGGRRSTVAPCRTAPMLLPEPVRHGGLDTAVWVFHGRPSRSGGSGRLLVRQRPRSCLAAQGIPKPDPKFGAEALAFSAGSATRRARATTRGHKMMIHPNDWKGQLRRAPTVEDVLRARQTVPPHREHPTHHWVRVLLVRHWPPPLLC